MIFELCSFGGESWFGFGLSQRGGGPMAPELQKFDGSVDYRFGSTALDSVCLFLQKSYGCRFSGLRCVCVILVVGGLGE